MGSLVSAAYQRLADAVEQRPDDGAPPFVRLGPARAVSPLVVAVPHAGRHYPAAIDAARAVGWSTLAQLEDRYADRLIGRLPESGAVCFVARTARAWIDLNRAETEVAESDGARARAGLGLVPSRLAGRPLWRQPPTTAELCARIAMVHRPYHEALARALEEARALHGWAVLIDCHSMPPVGRGLRSPRLVIGDRHGRSAAAAVTRAAIRAAGASGIAVAHNAPYAGAHALERHGRPRAGIHALQVEVDRSLYLDAAGEPVMSGVDAMAERLDAIAWAAVAAAGERPTAIAAE